MKKLLSILTAAALITVCFAGCSQSGTSSQQSSASVETSQNSGELTEIDLILDWYPNAVHAFIYDAIEKGYYEEQGLKVNVLFPSNNNDAISLVAAGKADIGLYYQNDVIIARANENIPIKAIGTVVREPLDIIASIADKNINRPKDLEGKTLGYTGTEFCEAVIKQMMEADSSSVDKLSLINVGFDVMSSMTTGNVDATFGCFINHEIPQLEKEGFDMNYFKLSDYGVPNYYSLVFVANEEKVNSESDIYQKFLYASSKGFYDMKTDPEGTLNILLEHQNADNFPLDPEVENKSLETLLPMMEYENEPFLSQNYDCYEENVNWLYSVGLIENEIEPGDAFADVIDQQYYLGHDDEQ